MWATVLGLTRETLPSVSRPSLLQYLLFVVESTGSIQETTFVRTEEGRSGTQEIRVWSPELKKLMTQRIVRLCNASWTLQTGRVFT